MAFVNQVYAAIADFITQRTVLQMDNKIFLDRPSANPLLALLARIGGSRTVRNMEFHYLTKATRPPYIPLSYAFAGTDDHFHVASGSGVWFTPGMVFYFKGYQYRVDTVLEAQSVHSGTHDIINLVGDDAWPTSQTDASVTGVVGDNIIMSYEVFGEKADAPLGNFIDTVDNYNYMEQFMRGVNLTQLMTKTQQYGQDVRALEHDLALQGWRTDIEMKMLLSKRYKDESLASTVGVIWNTGGMDEIITEKTLDYGGLAFDLDQLLAKIPDFLEFANADEWVWFANASFLSKLQLAAQDKIFYDTKDDSFGYAVQKWVTSFGSFPLVHARMLDKFPVPKMYLLNKNEIKLVTFEGVDSMEGAPRLYLNAQLPNQPNLIHDFYRGIMGIQRGWGKKHCSITNWATT